MPIGLLNSRMAGRLDEKQTAVNASILDVAVTLRSKLFAKVCRVLVLDIFHNWVPTSDMLARMKSRSNRCSLIPSVIIDLVTISGSIHDVESETDAILLNDCGIVRG